MRSLYSILSLMLALLSMNTLNSQTVYWTEDFGGGINGWTTESIQPTDTSVWVWSPDGNISEGAFSSGAISSETSGNGSMEFNADFYTSGGDPDNVPDDNTLYPKYVSELISPTIDLSDAVGGVDIQFTQFIRFLNVSNTNIFFRVYVQFSIDDGATWGDPINCAPLDRGYEINEFYNRTETFPACGVEGQSQVRIKFTFNSDFYFWVIDDIKLIKRPLNDMALINDFEATLPNYQWPLSMVEPVGFVNDIANEGGNAQTNVKSTITITNDDTMSDVYTDEQDLGTLENCEQRIDQIFPGYYTPDAAGNYTGTYEVTSDSTDTDPGDNTFDFNFIITDTLFAKEDGPTGLINLNDFTNLWDEDEPQSWAFGNYYYVPEAQGQFIRYLEIGIYGPGNKDEIITAKVYEWTDNNADEIAQPQERTALGFAFYVIQGTENPNNPVKLQVNDLLGDPIPLTDDTEYLIMIEFQTESTTQTINLIPFSEDTDYRAMVWRTQQDGEPRYASFLGIEGDLTQAEFSSPGFGYDAVAIARMSIGDAVEPNQTVSALDETNLTAVLPNPASDQLTLDLQFQEVMQEVRIDVFDMSGKIYQTRFLDQVQHQQVEFDVSTLNSGNYLLHITTDQGTRTERFTVVR